MHSSNVAAIQGLALRRLEKLPSNTLHSLSACLEGKSLHLRAVIQPGLPALQLDKLNIVLSVIVEDLKYVLGKQWNVRSEKVETPDSQVLEPLQFEIFNCQNNTQ